MAVILWKALEGYHYLNEDLQDPRVGDYPLLSLLHVVGFILLYNFCVQSVLPWWIKDRPAYNLRKIIIVYDFAQVVINTYLVIRVIRLTYWTGNYNIYCQEVEKGTSPEEIMLLDTAFWYYLLKLCDLLDTVLFVLTKKASHVSFLHVYHHSGMILGSWAGMKYIPGGQSVLFGTINSTVHSLMYTYYLLAALKYLDSRHVFWKRSLTQLQMVQFGLIFLHHTSALLSNCQYPALPSLLVVPQTVFMLVLFADFYKKAYIVKPKEKPV